jgi:hypothetical protein
VVAHPATPRPIRLKGPDAVVAGHERPCGWRATGPVAEAQAVERRHRTWSPAPTLEQGPVATRAEIQRRTSGSPEKGQCVPNDSAIGPLGMMQQESMDDVQTNGSITPGCAEAKPLRRCRPLARCPSRTSRPTDSLYAV